MKKPLLYSITVLFFATYFAVMISGAKPDIPTNQPDSKLQARIPGVKPDKAEISDRADFAGVIVKFREKSDICLIGNRLISPSEQSHDDINRVLKPYLNGKVTRLARMPEKTLSKMKEVYELASGRELADFNLYFKIDVTRPAEAESLINQLNRLDIVEIAYIEPRPMPAGDIEPPTPDYEGFQTYLNPAPDGVDAVYANALSGGDGSGIKIFDIELGWNENHEDLESAVGGTLNGGNDPYGNHGTAVLGEMIAGDNGYGVTGICPGVDIGMVSADINGTANAILMAVENMERGDIMLIELNAPGPRYDFEIRLDQLGYVCMEYWQDIFDALQYAWAKGVIVVEAAGNGAEDYDDALYGSLFDTTYRNSHAILVGAGAPPSGNVGVPLSRLGFSNHGSRVNLQADGREVFTTGYGYYWDGDGDPNQYYTSSFAGTSSAAPIVTGSIACIQGYYKALYGVALTADHVRDILIATGTPQTGDTTGQHIGPKPDLAAAIPALSSPPSLYTEPILIDTSVIRGTVSVTDVWIFNRSEGSTIEFEVTDDDSMLLYDPDWLSVSPQSGYVLPSDSLLLSVTLDASVIEDKLDIYKGLILINWGATGETLDSVCYVPVFLSVPCVPDSTYEVLSSDDPDGPIYSWVDITSIGTEIPEGSYYNSYASEPNDDGTAGPFTLPFNFPFYDTTYNRVYVGVNGGISFTDMDVNSNGFFSGFDIPGNPFNSFVAVFWNDFVVGNTGHAAHGSIHTYFTVDSAVIEWYQMGSYSSPADTMTTFEVILTRDGNIVMQYYDVGIGGFENTALIGINAFQCTATPYFTHGDPPDNTVGNNSAVRFIGDFTVPVMAGDANGDGLTNLLDITYIIAHLYKSGPAPDPLESGDVNCDETVNLLDITFMIAYLYKGGPDPCYFAM